MMTQNKMPKPPNMLSAKKNRCYIVVGGVWTDDCLQLFSEFVVCQIACQMGFKGLEVSSKLASWAGGTLLWYLKSGCCAYFFIFSQWYNHATFIEAL